MVQWSGGGGFGHYAWLLSDALAGQGIDVVLATRRSPELLAMPHMHRVAGFWPDAAAPGSPLRRAGILLHRLAGWARLTGAVVRRRGQGDIVHLQSADRLGELPFLLTLRASGATILATAHNALPHGTGRFGRMKMRVLYRVPHGIIAHTDEAAAEIRSLAGPKPALLAVPHPRYAPLADHFGTAAPPAPGDPLLVAHLGTIRPYKGLDRVVAAMVELRAQRSEIVLSVVGRANDADRVATVLAALTPDAVRTELGYVSIERLVNEARRADVVLLGHRSTSESGVAHLALGAGAVVVGPRMAAIERLLAPEPSWLYDPDEPEDLARVLAEVLSEVAADRPGLRVRARAVADAVPSWEQSAVATIAFARQLNP